MFDHDDDKLFDDYYEDEREDAPEIDDVLYLGEDAEDAWEWATDLDEDELTLE